jgi:hypothetical protein
MRVFTLVMIGLIVLIIGLLTILFSFTNVKTARMHLRKFHSEARALTRALMSA